MNLKFINYCVVNLFARRCCRLYPIGCGKSDDFQDDDNYLRYLQVSIYTFSGKIHWKYYLKTNRNCGEYTLCLHTPARNKKPHLFIAFPLFSSTGMKLHTLLILCGILYIFELTGYSNTVWFPLFLFVCLFICFHRLFDCWVIAHVRTYVIIVYLYVCIILCRCISVFVSYC